MPIGATEVTVTCFICHHTMTLPADTRRTTCSKCGATGRWFRCATCHKTAGFWVKSDGPVWTFKCPSCGANHKNQIDSYVKRPTTPPQRAVNFGVMLVIAALAIFAVFVASLPFNRPYPKHFLSVKLGTEEGAQSSTLAITGAVGKVVKFNVKTDAREGWWASNDGMTLTLTGVDGPIVALKPVKVKWGDKVDATAKNIDITGTFRVPSVAGPEEQVLSGHLTGDVIRPMSENGKTFNNRDFQFDFPVTLTLVSPAQYREPHGAHGYWLLGINVWVTLAIMLGGLVVISVFNSDKVISVFNSDKKKAV